MVPGSVKDPISRSKLESDQERHWNMLSLTLHKHDIQITHWYRHVHKPKWIRTDPPTHTLEEMNWEVYGLLVKPPQVHLWTTWFLFWQAQAMQEEGLAGGSQRLEALSFRLASFPNSFLTLFPHCPEVNGFLHASAHGNRTNVPWIKTFGTISPE